MEDLLQVAPAMSVLTLLVLMASTTFVDPETTDAVPAVNETIVVTPSATERTLSDEPASVTVIEREELIHDPSLVLDDLLQSVPGFSLFRRQSSIVAHPTTQGVSLRGTGASGAGRTLVLRDGIPLNDPFGGWVLWGRTSRQSLERIEVVRGGGAELYGTSAVGGVIQLFPVRATDDSVTVEGSAGELDTVSGSLFGSTVRGAWSGTLSANGFATDGWFIRPEGERGAVDRRARSDHWLTELRVNRSIAGGQLFTDLSRYEESRDNGTVVQQNGTDITMAAAGVDWSTGPLSINARGWISDQEMASTFSAVADDRDSERLVRDQSVPADALGANARVVRPLGERHLLVGGTELRRVEATSHETVFIPGREIPVRSGGEQTFTALWLEDVVDLPGDLELTAGLRWDRWTNRNETDGSERDDSALSPRISLLYRMIPALALTASAYQAFRAPTLNELYRGFRVGDVVTDPNAALEAETMTGIETGINAGSGAGPWTARARVFWMEVDDPVANVTVDVSDDLILRQRRNLGMTRSSGIEADATWRLLPALRLRAGWLWSDSEIVDYAADRAIEGNRVPQVPEHQGTLELRWSGSGTSAAVQTHYVGDQFEDDENRYVLPSYVTVDLHVSRAIGSDLSVFVAGENVLDERWLAGRTPDETIGPPRLVRAGLRWTTGF